MEPKRIEIVELDVQELIEKLNKAYVDEWLAYYQYWIASKLIKGPLRIPIAEELMAHAGEELGHATKIADRIIQLGGTPILSPDEWLKESHCGFSSPKDVKSSVIVKQVIEGEQCAIGYYNDLLAFIKDSDVITYQLIVSILKDEVDHEEEFQNFLEDLKGAK